MKRAIKTIIIAIVVSIPFFLSAQEPPHPNNGNGPTPSGNTPVGGGAPIGSGLTILVTLGAMYAGKKVYHLNRD